MFKYRLEGKDGKDYYSNDISWNFETKLRTCYEIVGNDVIKREIHSDDIVCIWKEN